MTFSTDYFNPISAPSPLERAGERIIPAIVPVQTSSPFSFFMITRHFNFPNLKYIFSEITIIFSFGKTGFKNSISVDVKAIEVFLLNESFNKKIPKQTKPICAITSVKITPGVTGLPLKCPL